MRRLPTGLVLALAVLLAGGRILAAQMPQTGLPRSR